MLRIDQLRLLPDQPESDLTAKCARLLRTDPSSLRDLTVLRRAIDAREGLTFVYTVAVSAPQEAALLRRCRDKRVTAYTPEHYALPAPVAPPEVRPIVVGAGPAGLFAALVLARKLLRRYERESDSRKAMQKLLMAMARRGYGFEEARAAAQRAIQEPED